MADGEIPTATRPQKLHSATHTVLFEEVAGESTRCDVCNQILSGAEDTDPDGYAVGGSGLYLWTRGDEVRYEEPPLCGRCGTAIGVMALAQWDLEEDEG
ncbi:hypothetical protein LZC95_16790 [Pendulispora brunnea]|uniref:Uncharacterized protein n=1 Tax=Pendulispora brunnea TaxID=2905690 RepID=A0ABZ2KMD5_9BACT